MQMREQPKFVLSFVIKIVPCHWRRMIRERAFWFLHAGPTLHHMLWLPLVEGLWSQCSSI